MRRYFLFMLIGSVVFVGLHWRLTFLGIPSGLTGIAFFNLLISFGIWIPVLDWMVDGRRKTGSLVKEVGVLPFGQLYLAIGVAIGFISLVSIAYQIYDAIGGSLSFVAASQSSASSVLFGSASINWIVYGRSRLAIYQHGLYYAFSFLKWSDIVSYQWDVADPNLLVLAIKQGSTFSIRPISKLPIPAEQRNEIDQILTAKVKAGRVDNEELVE